MINKAYKVPFPVSLEVQINVMADMPGKIYFKTGDKYSYVGDNKVSIEFKETVIEVFSIEADDWTNRVFRGFLTPIQVEWLNY